MKLKQPDINGLLKKNHKVSKPTPMMAQYLEVKERHKEYLLFYRMGDFYELFFEDAEVAASNLGIALTKRGKIGDKDIPMCGVPYHSAQTYLSRLIKQGFKVAIAEQLGESEEESKSQKIFKRDVVRIITPGTIIEDSLLDSKNNNNLLSIFLHKGLISIAWVDMTSGLIKLERIEGKNFLQYLTESIHKIEPGEIIVSEEIKNSKILNEKLGIFDKQISYIPHTFYDHKNNTDVINNFFDIKKIQSLADLNQTDIAVIGALINYLKLTQKNNIPKIRNVEIVSREKFMQIDMFTLKSLEIFERYDGVKKGSLIDTIDKTQTACGARMLRYFLKAPLIDNKEIEFRHNLIESFLYNFSTLEIIIKLLASVPDLERALARVTAGTNNPRDLILIKQFINFTKKIFRELENLKEKNLHKLIPDKKVIDKATTIEKLIDENIEDTPPINLNDGGVIKGSVDKRLDELRNIKQIKTEEIIKETAFFSNCAKNGLHYQYDEETIFSKPLELEVVTNSPSELGNSEELNRVEFSKTLDQIDTGHLSEVTDFNNAWIRWKGFLKALKRKVFDNPSDNIGKLNTWKELFYSKALLYALTMNENSQKEIRSRDEWLLLPYPLRPE